MAAKHEVIKLSVMGDWTLQGRGRLYVCTQGTFKALYSDAVIRVSPFPKKCKMAFPDLFGFEIQRINEGSGYSEDAPIFTVVEVKTLSDRIKPGQKDFLNWAITQGIRAYVAWEDNDKPSGYRLEEWEG